MKLYYFTEAGYEKLRKEIEELERYLKSNIAKEIATAREHGDLRENAEYEAAKNKQANYMAKLGLLQERFQHARIIRKSDGRQDAAEKLMKRFRIDQEQVDAIVELRLYKLARLEIRLLVPRRPTAGPRRTR